MNHLAHAYLGNYLHDEAIVGNFVADYARGAVENLPYSDGVKQGITMHRAIDSFTDAHDAVHAACALIHSTQHKYAPIVIDVCFDYFIANDWARLSPNIDLHNFGLHVCNALQTHEKILPEILQKRLPTMIQHNFLTSYAKYDGLQFAFQSIAKRTHFDNKLLTALDDFKQYETELHVIFNQFFPDLQQMVLSNLP